MYDERKLHVKPWRGGRRRRVYGRWPTVIGWMCIAVAVGALSLPALILAPPSIQILGNGETSAYLLALCWLSNPHDVLFACLTLSFREATGPGSVPMAGLVTAIILTLLAMVLHLAGGIGLLRRRAAARPVLLTWSGIMIASQAWGALYCLAEWQPAAVWLALPGLPWPVFLLAWFSRRSIRKQAAGWPGGAGEDKISAATTTPRRMEPRPAEWWKQWDA